MSSQSIRLIGNLRRFQIRSNQFRKYGPSIAASRCQSTSSYREEQKRKKLPDDGVTLSHFISNSQSSTQSSREEEEFGPIPISAPLGIESSRQLQTNRILKFHLKTYGCQMNVSDSDIIRSILLDEETNLAGHQISFEETQEEMDADVLLTNTCAIRENAEIKVWNRLHELRAHDSKNPLENLPIVGIEQEDSDGSQLINSMGSGSSMKRKKKIPKRKRIIGVLGCMAERLKEDMFKDGTADLIVGPDAYRDLPRLISALAPIPGSTPGMPQFEMPMMERALNVELSFDETYADVTPVRANPGDVHAFVSVMRGCNNMCSYCVVPFTRGRERSRELESILREARVLYEESGVKEICLLGQNVNSYHDRSDSAILAKPAPDLAPNEDDDHSKKTMYKAGYQTSNDGFSNIFRLRGGAGHYFVDLVEAVSDISPELRVRFTSPHPKDYPPELLSLMAERNNVCNHLHMPAQSGSSTVLERMRRGYSREAYMELIDDVRSMIPDVAITSDFITGFCGETEEEHEDTLSLMDYVKYDQAFMFAYSMRGKTHANRTMEDDVPEDIKLRRLQEIISMFRTNVQRRNDELEVGKLRLVLVEGESRKSKEGARSWGGRTDQNKRVIFPIKGESPECWSEDAVNPIISALNRSYPSNDMVRSDILHDFARRPKVEVQAGDYAVVQVNEARGHTLKGKLLWRASMQGFHEMGLDQSALDLFSAMAK
jgi:tRNA A37 methylthiotransferase MiaB